MKKKATKKISTKKNITVSGSLWIEVNGKKIFGPGPAELLKHIDDTGSINKAAKQMKMSYKKAWILVNTINKHAAQPMVVVQTGGEKGGGSEITAYAKQFIKYHHLLRKRFAAFLTKETKNIKN